jgi:hypothetical protein
MIPKTILRIEQRSTCALELALVTRAAKREWQLARIETVMAIANASYAASVK